MTLDFDMLTEAQRSRRIPENDLNSLITRLLEFARNDKS
jgi:hypothetical protein